MKNLSLKEMLQNNLRELQTNDVRQYHLTHDFYSGQKLNSNYKFNQAQNDADHKRLVDQNDLDVINALLFPHPTMGSVFTEALTGFETSSRGEELPQAVIKKSSVDLLDRLINYYEQYLESGLGLLLSTQSDRLDKKSIYIIQAAYPMNTIIVQNICILSEFWIRSPFSWEPDAGIDLLDYLFVEYQAPACLKKCWYETATQENLQWLITYILYAQGGSVKKIAAQFDWIVTSNKLWHQMLQAPAYLLPNEAVLYCEFQRLNGTDEVYQFLVSNKAYAINLLSNPNQYTLDFWYSMVRWLTLNEDQIIGTEMARILVWARHQFTEFEKAGRLFSMNGRSCVKVQAETLEYHQAIVARRVEIARRTELRRLAALARLEAEEVRAEEARLRALENQNFPSYQWKKLGLSWVAGKKTVGQWEFCELSTSEELFKEGEAMCNCVGGYDESCNEGLSAIVSLRFNGRPKVTIEIDPETRALVQASGHENQDITQSERKLIKRWLTKCVSSFSGSLL